MPDKKPLTPTDADPLHLRAIRLALNGSYHFSKRLAGLWCYRVLARPPRKALLPSEKNFLMTAQQKVFPVGIMNIQMYHWPGTGPKILLAHGWNSHSGRWQALASQLITLGYDVYALDAPAHGASFGGSFAVIHYGEALAKLADTIAPNIIIGHSAGGMATAYYLRHFPKIHHPDKLVLLSTPAELNHFMESFRKGIGIKKAVIEAMENSFTRRFGKSFDYFSIANFVQNLRIPGLIIHDQEDDIAPVEGAYALAENWATSELVITTGLGHSVQDEQVRKRILDWLT
ncbi:alpha/beta hydrolase [Lewinella sp. LCG006]|uniref:alpha/beta hydrolase n=1 Tax=Lewinella sp. LCG006 TaxID=3231911 RepID=UPI0034612FD9